MFKIIKKIKYNNAFTIVELMVVVSIVMVVTSISVFNYGSFKSKVSLQNLANDIALSIRKAQSFATGVRGFGESTSNKFEKSYGIHFSTDSSPDHVLDGSKKTFLMFSSVDKKYDNDTSHVCNDGSHECVEFFNINGSDIIKEIYLDGVLKNAQKGTLDIVFTRPNLSAYFCYRANMSSSCQTGSSVSIKVSNNLQNEEKIKTINIQNTGQISIQ